QKHEGERVLLLEFFQRSGRIRRGCQDNRSGAAKLVMSVTKLGRFHGSTRSVGFGKKVEDDGFAAEVLQRNVLPILIGQSEVRRFMIRRHGSSSRDQQHLTVSQAPTSPG